MNNLNPEVLSSNSNYAITFIASILIWVLYAGLFLLFIKGGSKAKTTALQAFLFSAFAWIISQMIKDFLPVMRPFVINEIPPLTLTTPFDGSFPSGHAASAFALSVWIFMKNKKIGIIFVAGAVMVALGRVLSNVHYPLDVVGGAVLGTIISLTGSSFKFKNLLKKEN